jgi:hypothetical protein
LRPYGNLALEIRNSREGTLANLIADCVINEEGKVQQVRTPANHKSLTAEMKNCHFSGRTDPQLPFPMVFATHQFSNIEM